MTTGFLLWEWRHFFDSIGNVRHLGSSNLIWDCLQTFKNPFFRIVGYGLAGCEPSIMGIGPVPSIRALMAKAGLKLEDIDQVKPRKQFYAHSIVYFLS
jgi:hypothetical protein